MERTVIPEWTVGDRLRKARQIAGYENDAEGFAELIGVSRNSIGNYEKRGTDKPIVLRAYEAHTGVPQEWLLTGRVTRPRQDSNLRLADYIAERWASGVEKSPELDAARRGSRRRQQRRRCDTLPTTARPVPAVTYLAEWRASTVA